ncbi:MAG: FeoB-associated Cys-rich membrane protein [Oscillospiraceae bacterium]|nr:FeoB-associated Cys-rich membrane protein [Oscillospiraceae bacterium]MBQ2635050.1 FeoB-associated Cys-rich membrane protein [Oscillospiraceae bacterium]
MNTLDIFLIAALLALLGFAVWQSRRAGKRGGCGGCSGGTCPGCGKAPKRSDTEQNEKRTEAKWRGQAHSLQDVVDRSSIDHTL